MTFPLNLHLLTASVETLPLPPCSPFLPVVVGLHLAEECGSGWHRQPLLCATYTPNSNLFHLLSNFQMSLTGKKQRGAFGSSVRAGGSVLCSFHGNYCVVTMTVYLSFFMSFFINRIVFFSKTLNNL